MEVPEIETRIGYRSHKHMDNDGAARWRKYRVRRLLEDLRLVTRLRSTQCLHFCSANLVAFLTTANYEIGLPPNLGLPADGGLCTNMS